MTPAIVAGVTGALSAVTLALAWLNHQGPSEFVGGNQANMWLAGLVFGIVAALVLRDRPDNRLGLVFAVASVLVAVCAAAAELADVRVRGRCRSGPGSRRLGGQRPVDARPSSCCSSRCPCCSRMAGSPPPVAPAGSAGAAGWAVAVLAYATTDEAVHDGYPQAENPFDLPLPDDPQLAVALVGFLTAVFGGRGRDRRAGPADAPARPPGAGTVRLVRDRRGARGPSPSCSSRLVRFAGHALAVVAWLGIVRHQLFDIEAVLSRAVVYAILTAAALAAYLLAASLLGSRTDAGVGPAVVAAVVALLLAGVVSGSSASSTSCSTGSGGTPSAR